MVALQALDKLKRLLDCPKSDATVSTSVEIIHDDNSKLKKLFLTDISSNMLLLQLDNGVKKHRCTGFSKLFNSLDDCDHNKVCDALLLKATERGLAATYIELKSDDATGYVGQFKSTKCFVGYLEKILQDICNIDVKISSERYVVFHTDSSNASRSGFQLKKTTKFNQTQPNTPEQAHKSVVKSGDSVRVTEFA